MDLANKLVVLAAVAAVWVAGASAVGRMLRQRSAGGEDGQTTAEYALVILGAAAIAGLLIAWATDSGAVEDLFDSVIDRVAGDVG